MKTTTNPVNKILIASSAILLAGTVTFGLLYMSAHKSDMKSQSFGRTCIKSFVRAVDLALCEEDMFLGNVKARACTSYKNTTIDDMKRVRSLGYDNEYNYIGAD